MDKEVMRSLLAHAYYSFAEIDWDFDSLTIREKCLIKNQDILDKIRDAININTYDQLLGANPDEGLERGREHLCSKKQKRDDI